MTKQENAKESFRRIGDALMGVLLAAAGDNQIAAANIRLIHEARPLPRFFVRLAEFTLHPTSNERAALLAEVLATEADTSALDLIREEGPRAINKALEKPEAAQRDHGLLQIDRLYFNIAMNTITYLVDLHRQNASLRLRSRREAPRPANDPPPPSGAA